MTNWIKFLLGLNAASVIRGLRLGFPEFVKGSIASLDAAHPRQDKEQNRVQRDWKAIPVVSLDEVLGERKAPVALTAQKYEDGMLPSREEMVLLSIVVAENPRELLEIGTYMGHTTRALAENLPLATIHTLDLPPDFSVETDRTDGPPKDDLHLIGRREVGREFKGRPVAQRIHQHFGDSATFDFKQFGNSTLFFIDGAHTYEYCKQDSEKCFALCQGVGTFIWHDCDDWHPGVLKFVLEWRSLGREIRRIEGTALAYWKAK